LQNQDLVRHERGLRHYGGWVNEKDVIDFRSRVRPAVGRVLAGHGIPVPPPPVEHERGVVASASADVIAGRFSCLISAVRSSRDD
jgi:hypothetical protein